MGGAVDHEILMCIERILYVTQVKNKKYAQERKQETETNMRFIGYIEDEEAKIRTMKLN